MVDSGSRQGEDSPVRRYLETLSDLSLRSLWNIVSNPAMLRVKLSSPPNSTSVDAASAVLPDTAREAIEESRLEYLREGIFFADLDKNMIEKRRRRSVNMPWHEFLYIVIRLSRPNVIFETGVFDGQSSSIILQALHRNARGLLVSVDLPAVEVIAGSTHRMGETSLPLGCQPGWAIPQHLRERHRLCLGDSKKLLPDLLRQFPVVDAFFHDSLHTFEHQDFEYRLAWRHLRPGGFLFSDDILWTPAFHKFCREQHRPYLRLGNFGATTK
jgi:predicted O-methyltransferase YrrM